MESDHSPRIVSYLNLKASDKLGWRMVDRDNERFMLVSKKKIDLKKQLNDVFVFNDFSV